MNPHELDQHEAKLVNRLRHHPVLSKELDVNTAHHILLQRRFISFEFTKFYDYCIDAIQDNEARLVARKILRDEYPGDGKIPSHREDLFSDLISIGIDIDNIFRCSPTPNTKMVILSIEKFLRSILSDTTFREISALSALRFWGEVLNSIEYKCLWDSFLRNRLRNKADTYSKLPVSMFYSEHIEHDSATTTFSGKLAGSSHSDLITLHLKRLAVDGQMIALIADTDSKCVRLKEIFYDQFAKN